VKTLGVGVIGCGSIATSVHLPALNRLGSLARLVHVCDVRGAVAEQTARRHGAPRWTTDHRVLLDDPAVDAIIIATPEILHAEETIDAARAGKHVLCEKPIAATLDEADRMITATEQAGVRFMVGHSRRFTGRYRAVHEILVSGAVGAPVLIRENERRPRAQYSVLNLPVDIWQPEPERPQPWKDLARYSGGVARGHAIHELDLFRWFAGAEARSVQAEAKITVPGREVPDAITVQVEFLNDVLGACDLYSQAPTGYPYYHQLEIIGTDGILRARDSDMITLTSFDGHGMHHPAAYESLLHIDDAYVVQQRLFYEAVLSGGPLPLDPRDARAALEITLAAMRAAETGQRVELPLSAAPAGGRS
jgi:myo-inositol 2-dehydrogenase/D-chiro-inositol 1-dehydrogenase